MNQKVVEVEVRAILPSGGSCALFMGNSRKVFVIHIDPSIGAAVANYLRGGLPARPLTYDLIANLLLGLGAKMERAIINELRGGIFHARLIVSEQNEIHDNKIVEIDARSSDCIALAVRLKAPIFVSESVWDEIEDVSELLEKMQSGGQEESQEEDEKED